MIDPGAHRAEVEAWRAARYERLRGDIGWLTLAGLGWLREGTNRIGADSTCDVVLPAGPAEAGVIVVAGDEVVADGAFIHEGRPVAALTLVQDETMLELEDLRIGLIRRGGRPALRIWNLASELRASFSGIDHWAIDPNWRFEARFEPIERTIEVPDVLGDAQPVVSPGDVVFGLDGRELRLQSLQGGDAGELWLVFGDATNGTETYGGGRFLYTPPVEDGNVIVDFNLAYNPPCVFSPYATCPLPWPANRLPIRIDAGERNFRR